MESLVKLFFEWEIQLLVVLSFILQMFLFFTGSLRRHNTNTFLRFFIWTTYLGADLVAVYALGYLSRHEDVAIVRHILRRAQPLAFFWAPFLLIHLGGQDTITAFAMEDNNLWLRHLLNLVVQVVLAIYVFWKSIGRHSIELLVSGVFVFVAGIIKYGERTWSLKCGSFKCLESSTGDQYRPWSLEVAHVDADYYSNVVWDCLCSMPDVLDIFAGRSLFAKRTLFASSSLIAQDNKRMFQVVELQLGMMFDDLYTKALVLRTGSGITLRCISQISAVVAFALFLASNKPRYNRADIAITYSLFIGALFMDLCAMFIFIMSPWTWAWLKAQKYHRLARLSWFLFSSNIGWPEKRPQCSNSMGQYNLVRWHTSSDQPARTCNQQVMTVVRRLVNLLGAKREKIFWMSKLLDNEYVEVDEKTMECVLKGISGIHDEFSQEPREWPKLRRLPEKIQKAFIADFGYAIVFLHMFTRQHLSKYDPPPSDTSDAMVEVCRKLSNYMIYLFVTHPEMLPLNASAVATLSTLTGSTVQEFNEEFNEYGIEPGKETLEEMVDLWTRLLIYAAGKSRPEAHAAQLARGGELFTSVWLLMAQQGLGDSMRNRILITNASVENHFKEVYAFWVPPEGRSFPES